LYESHLFGDTFVDCLNVVPSVQPLLQRLAERYTLALATGVHPDLLRDRVMPRFDIPDVFSSVRSSYDLPDVNLAKPHPFAVLDLLQEFGVPAQDAVVVGDAANDVRMAQGADVEPIVVLGGHLDEVEAKELGVRFVIPDVTHVESVLATIESER
jgi:phosphoglycolate phosphatase